MIVDDLVPQTISKYFMFPFCGIYTFFPYLRNHNAAGALTTKENSSLSHLNVIRIISLGSMNIYTPPVSQTSRKPPGTWTPSLWIYIFHLVQTCSDSKKEKTSRLPGSQRSSWSSTFEGRQRKKQLTLRHGNTKDPTQTWHVNRFNRFPGLYQQVSIWHPQTRS